MMFACALAIGIGLFPACGAAHARPDIADLKALVDRLTPDSVASRTSFDATFGTELVDEGGSNYWVHSRATDVVLGRNAFRQIELRAPRPGGGATAGPILVLDLDFEADACIPVDDVRNAYPDLEWLGPDSPSNSDPDETLERRHGAARLFFSFPIYGPDCLRTIVYRFDDPL